MSKLGIYKTDDCIAKRYSVDSVLSAFANGMAYRCHDIVSQQQVAVRTFFPEVLAQEDYRRRFSKVATHAMLTIQHKNVLQVIDVINNGDESGCVLESIENGDLSDILTGDALPELDQALALILDILSGLEAIHVAGIMHLNVEPSRIFLTKNGQPKVGDYFDSFCLFDERSAVSLTQVGLIDYLAPERISNPSALNLYTDIFSIGVIMFRLLTGAYPFPRRYFEGEDPARPALAAEHLEQLPIELHPILMRALAIDPAERFQSARDMAGALSRTRSVLLVQ